MDINASDLREASTAVGNWIWERIGKELLSNLPSKAMKKWTARSWDDSATEYKHRLLKIHSTTKLLGNPKEIDLGKLFTDVYALDQVSAFRRLELEELNRRAADGSVLDNYVVRKPLLDVSKHSNRLYILGKPGSGKSTFLKAIVRLCCIGTIDKIPVFVALRDWMESGESIDQFIINEFKVCDFPEPQSFVESILESGEVVFLFDGLDEVPNKNNARRKTIRTLTMFCNKYPKAKVMVTCRTAATDYSFSQFDYFEIADFSRDQQLYFLEKWYSDSPDLLHRILSEWNDNKNKALIDLAKTPLLLALLCLAFDETRLIPRRRIELYEESINALLRKWDSSREIDRDELYRSFSHIRKEQLFSKIAMSAFEEGSIFVSKKKAIKYIRDFVSELPPEDLREQFDGEVILKTMEAQHGIFVERACDIYAFSHLTIHEYFVAKSISENVKGNAL